MSRAYLFIPLFLITLFALWVAPYVLIFIPRPEKQIECNWDLSKTRMADAMGWPNQSVNNPFWAPRCSLLKLTIRDHPTATYLNVWPWLFKSGVTVTGINLWFPNESADKIHARARRLIDQWNLDTPGTNPTLDQWFARVTHENPDHDPDPNWNGPKSHPGSFPTISLTIRDAGIDFQTRGHCWAILLQIDYTPADQPVTAAAN